MPPKKTQKMSLGTFLQDENFGSWADEMEDMPLPAPSSRTSYGTERRGFGSDMGASTMRPELRQYSVREQLPLPDKPPFTAHLANLSFEATQLDIESFFAGCEVTNVRIVEDKLDRKPKGFGYVEFGTQDGLKAALDLSGSNLAGRQVRISVADPPKDRQDSRDYGDWTRKGPLPDLPNQRRVSDRPGFNRSFENMSDAGSERGGRRGFGGDDGKVRDFSNWERKGPLSPTATNTNLSLRDGGRQGSKDGNFRRNSPSWGEGRSTEGSRPRPERPERGERPERPLPERQPTAADLDNQWRARMRPDAPANAEASEPSTPSSPVAPASRPKLNLQKRTVSEAPTDSATSGGDSKASPFGAARPVDTAAKEREVAEKRELAVRQKREADEKAKAEKAEEKRQVKEKAAADKTDVRADDAEESEEQPTPTPKFDILRRAESGTNDMIDDEDADENEEIGQAEDKAVKPKEIVRDAPAKANGAWRRGPEAASESSTAATLEEDGWSTVPKGGKQRNNKKNNTASRAIAS